MPGWQGMTIKEILEKVDLFNISALVDEDKKPTEGLGMRVIPSSVPSWLARHSILKSPVL